MKLNKNNYQIKKIDISVNKSIEFMNNIMKDELRNF